MAMSWLSLDPLFKALALHPYISQKPGGFSCHAKLKGYIIRSAKAMESCLDKFCQL